MSSPRLAPWLMPGDDHVGLEALDQPERGEPHAVHRRAVAGVADRPVVERHLLHPQRAAEGDRARGRGAVAVRRDHRQLDVLERDQRAPQRLQALGVDAVVVGEQDPQHRPIDSTDGPGSSPPPGAYGGSDGADTGVAVCRTARRGGALADARRARALRAPRRPRRAGVRRPRDRHAAPGRGARRDRRSGSPTARSRQTPALAVRRPVLEAAVADVVAGARFAGEFHAGRHGAAPSRSSPTARGRRRSRSRARRRAARRGRAALAVARRGAAARRTRS